MIRRADAMIASGLGVMPTFGSKETFMKRIATLVVFFALMIPASASAGSGSTCQAYNPQDCTPVGTAHNTVDATTATTNTVAGSTGTLPFTGFDALLLVAGGGALLGAGLIVRRVARQID